MTPEEKLELFKDELILIPDGNVREFVKDMLLKVPDYFYEVAASSSGKYHPQISLGKGGLVRHTKAATRIGFMLLQNNAFNIPIESRSVIIAALILHDCLKHDVDYKQHTVKKHPTIAANFILENTKPEYMEIAKIVVDLIKPHMGQWNMDRSVEILPKPVTKNEKFVHICDYIASRKCLEFNFDVGVS